MADETFRTYLQESSPGSFLAGEESLQVVFARTLQRENLPAKIMNDLRAITAGGRVGRVIFSASRTSRAPGAMNCAGVPGRTTGPKSRSLTGRHCRNCSRLRTACGSWSGTWN
jgi:hypothetical protein